MRADHISLPYQIGKVYDDTLIRLCYRFCRCQYPGVDFGFAAELRGPAQQERIMDNLAVRDVVLMP
jgi:hypothetical protein